MLGHRMGLRLKFFSWSPPPSMSGPANVSTPILRPHQCTSHSVPQRSPWHTLFPLPGGPSPFPPLYITVPRYFLKEEGQVPHDRGALQALSYLPPSVAITSSLRWLSLSPTPSPNWKLHVGRDWVTIVSSALSPHAQHIVGPQQLPAQCQMNSSCWIGRGSSCLDAARMRMSESEERRKEEEEARMRAAHTLGIAAPRLRPRCGLILQHLQG